MQSIKYFLQGFLIGLCLIVISYGSYMRYDAHYNTHGIYKRILNELKAEYGESASGIHLVFSDDIEVNAWAQSDGSVTVTAGMEGLLGKNEDAIATLMAHEMSHITLGHVHGWVFSAEESRAREQQADRMGALLVDRAGYDKCTGMKVLMGAIAWVFDDTRTISEDTHPAPLGRIADICQINLDK